MGSGARSDNPPCTACVSGYRPTGTTACATESCACEECPIGQYSSSGTACTAVSTCPDGQIEQVAATSTSDRTCAVPPDDVPNCVITSGTCVTHLTLLECNALAWYDNRDAVASGPTQCTVGADKGCYLDASGSVQIADAGTTFDTCATACYARQGAGVTQQVALDQAMNCYCLDTVVSAATALDPALCTDSAHSHHAYRVADMGTCVQPAHSAGCSYDDNGHYFSDQPDALPSCTSTCLCKECLTTTAPTKAPTPVPTPAPTPACTLSTSGRCAADTSNGDLNDCFGTLLAFSANQPLAFTTVALGITAHSLADPHGCFYQRAGDVWSANVNTNSESTVPCSDERPCACKENCYYLPVVTTTTASPTAAPTASPTAVPTSFPTAAPTAYPTTVPTAAPTAAPTGAPTASPTPAPTPRVPVDPGAKPDGETGVVIIIVAAVGVMVLQAVTWRVPNAV